ncbi:MAG TPA: hypothetical protein VIL92_11910 [Gaiellaceae bacterium]
MASTAARAYLAFGVLAVALNAAFGGSNTLYDGIGLTSAALIFVGTAMHRPRAWRAWVGIGASQALFAVGDIVYRSAAGSPSWSDAFYLGGDALLIVSIGWLVVSTGRIRDLSSNLDACLLALIAGVCGWALFASDAMTHGTMASRAISVAYPVADLVLLALLLRAVFVRGTRAPSYWLLLGAVIPLFLSDGGDVMPTINGSYRPGGWLDAGWLLSYVLLAVAALHPSMARLVVRGSHDDTSLPVRRALVLGLGLIAVPSALLVQHNHRISDRGFWGRDRDVPHCRRRCPSRWVPRTRPRAHATEGRAIGASLSDGVRACADRNLHRQQRDDERDESRPPSDARLHQHRVGANALHRRHAPG